METVQSRRRTWGVGAKVSASVLVLVGAFFALLITVIGYSLGTVFEDRANSEVAEKTKLVVDLVDESDKDLRGRINGLGKAFQSNLNGAFTLESSTIDIAGKPTPALALNGQPLNLQSWWTSSPPVPEQWQPCLPKQGMTLCASPPP